MRERLAKIKSMEKELAELKKVKPKLDSRFEKVDPYDDRWHKPNFGSETGREPAIIVVTRGDAHLNAGTYAGGHPGKNYEDGLVDITHGCYVLSKNGRTWKRLRPRTGTGIITWAEFDKECINAIYVARHENGNYFTRDDVRQLWIGTYRW